jgi:hypothetical protein
MIFWFIIKMLGKAVLWLFAVYGAYHALPTRAKKDGADLLKRVREMHMWLRGLLVVIASGLAVLYLVGDVKQEWFQHKAMFNSTSPAKDRAIALGKQLITFAKTNTTRATVDPAGFQIQLGAIFDPSIEKIRRELLEHGARSEELERRCREMHNLVNHPKMCEEVIALGEEFIRVAGQIEN